MSISSSYLSLQPSYFIDLNEGHEELYDHHQVIHHHTMPFSFSSLNPHHNSSSVSSLSSSSSSPSPICLNSVQDQAGYCYMGSQIQPYPYQQEVENLSSYESGSCDQTTLEINKRAKNGLKFSICKKEDKNFGGVSGGDGGTSDQINGSSVKWMSSKMRLMKKMMKTEEDQKLEVDNRFDNTLVIKSSNNGCNNNNNNNNNNNENATIRVCSDCNTTKTPLWRSGPRGPKSLCNACGIRQRKARRAMSATAIGGNGSMLPSNPSSSMIRSGNNHKKISIHNNNGFVAQKKRSKIAKPSQRKLCFEEFALSLTKKLSIQQVFPKEEKEAAILLMALSCGLVHG